MRIVFAGTPEFAVPPLAALCASRHSVVGVLTQPDRPAGRGRKLGTSAVKDFALQHDLPLAQPLSLRAAEGREPLLHWQPEVIVVVAYGLILPLEVLSLPRFGCLNIHASLLPRWRGAAPIQRAILAGDEYTGVTLMQMDVGLDTGPMLLQRRVPIDADTDSLTLHATLARLGAEALLETLEGLEAGTLSAQPQPSSGVTYASKIDKAEARIDWRQDAIDIARRVRAFRPWPIAETTQRGEQVRIHEAVVLDDSAVGRLAGTAPGTLLGLHADRLVVACGRDCLGVGVLQRAGRRSVTAREFANTAAALTESFQ
ncbi:MAG: methionyl-tRNA formyltransferase [Gammaproteobacteria bacterium]|nr:methionyl-tRNA formyltransferase [Gammaproteobacteria bacterium]